MSDPQPQVKPFVNGRARPLQCDILAMAADVEWADGRIAISAAKGEGLEGSPGGAETNRLGLVPASAEAPDDRVKITDHNQIQRIAFDACPSICRGLGKRRQIGAKLRLITGDRVRQISDVLKPSVPVIDLETRNRD